MLRCREATRLLSEGQDHRLSALVRLRLRLHLLVCTACRRYLEQVTLIRQACQRYADQ